MAQHAIHALALGCLYALLAAGLVLLSSAQRSWYLAYSGLYLVGGYVTWWTLQLSQPIWMALILSSLLCAVLGVVLTGLVRAVRAHRSERSQLLWGLGVLVCSMEVCRLMMGTYHRKVMAIDSYQIHYLGPLMLSDMHWLLLGCAFGCGVWLHGFLTTSRPGLILQTVLDDRGEPQRWHGLDPRWFAVAIGASLAGVGGGLAALYFNEVHPEMGLRMMHRILCLAIIGGVGCIRGAVLAAFGLACIEGLVVPMTADLLLPVEVYFLLALLVVNLWRSLNRRGTGYMRRRQTVIAR
jgi:branched-chain amino acid transport system permease protein